MGGASASISRKDDRIASAQHSVPRMLARSSSNSRLSSINTRLSNKVRLRYALERLSEGQTLVISQRELS
jgi:hypothetical protein